MEVRTGLGWDTHRLGWGAELILGGVRIPSDRGQLGQHGIRSGSRIQGFGNRFRDQQ